MPSMKAIEDKIITKLKDLPEEGKKEVLAYIDHFNGIESVTKKLEKLAPSGICTSIISVAELYEGVYGSRNYEDSLSALETFLEGITVLPIDQDVCRIFE